LGPAEHPEQVLRAKEMMVGVHTMPLTILKAAAAVLVQSAVILG
jgi:hypothetical protein